MSKIINRKIFGSLMLPSLFGIGLGADITNDVYNLKSITNNAQETYFIQNTRTYNAFNASFTQNYQNGTLVFGNNTNAQGSGVIWFGGYRKDFWNQAQGYVGYITANFNTKDVYLTGTLGARNTYQTGGGASFSFNASNDITMEGFKLQFDRAGTQNSRLSLTAAQKLTAKNLELSDASGGSISFSAKDMIFHAKNITTNGRLDFKGDGHIILDSLNISNGYFYAHSDGNLDIKNLNINNTTLKTTHADFSSITINNGSYKQDLVSKDSTLSVSGK